MNEIYHTYTIACITDRMYECEFKIDAHDLDKSLSRNVYY